MNYEVIEYSDETYPELLRHIGDAPKQLFCRGDISLLQSICISIVGTRKPTPYGAWASKAIAKRVAESGYTVVSGMAFGVDSAAHRGAIEACGRTIAVLGTGIDICFPSSNATLMKKIEETGLIVSEYPPGTRGTTFTFPRRNRIISGLSLGTVVVEAGIKSGSLITADMAITQGRTVFALPGNINNIMSIGCNKLLHDGAVPISVIDDVLWDLGLEPKFSEFSGAWDENDGSAVLSDEERSIMDALRRYGEMSAGEICEKVRIKPAEVAGMLTVLEMKGLIISSLGKFFVAN